jgi:hypothetical protein
VGLLDDLDDLLGVVGDRDQVQLVSVDVAFCLDFLLSEACL